MANRKVAPLSDTQVKNAKPKEKDYTLCNSFEKIDITLVLYALELSNIHIDENRL